MAVSGSTDFSVTANDIIKGALRVLGVIASGETPTAEEISDAKEALNMMVKSWMGPNNPLMPGLKMWARENATLNLSAKAVYSLKPSGGDLDIDIPVKILEAVLRDSNNNDTPMKEMTLEEYMAIGNKTETGDPLKYYYERRRDEGKLYLNLVPSDTTKTIFFYYLRPIYDFDSNTDNPDFPQEWYEALKYQLALRLAPEYGVPVTPELKGLADRALGLVQTFHPERSVLYFQPNKEY